MVEEQINIASVPEAKPPELPQQPKRKWIIAIVVGTILIVIATIILTRLYFLSLPKEPIQITQVPTPPKEPTVLPAPSKFATDAGVLKLREDLSTILGKIDSVDLFEPQLSQPNFDLNIHIDVQ